MAGAEAAIGDVGQFDSGHELEQFAGHVRRRADAGRRHVDLARIGLGIGDEFGDRLGRKRRIHHHHIGIAADAGDRRDVAEEIEVQLFVERCIDRVGDADQQEHVPVGRRFDDGLRGEIAAGARPVLHDEGLAEPLGQPLPYKARQDVGRAAGAEADDQAHWPGRISLRASNSRRGRQHGGARRQREKASARKFHVVAPVASARMMRVIVV